jgi:hypothetical protein
VTACAISTNSMRKKRFPCLLIDPSLCLSLELCSRGTSPKYDLFATLKARYVTECEHEGERGDGTTLGCVISNRACGISSAAFSVAWSSCPICSFMTGSQYFHILISLPPRSN